MSQEILLLIAVAVGVALIVYLEDGRIRGLIAAGMLAGVFFWRRNASDLPDSRPTAIEPRLPDTTETDDEITATDLRLERVNDARPGGNVGSGLELLEREDRDRDAHGSGAP